MSETNAQSILKNKVSHDMHLFLKTYFSSWSNRDIKSFKSHFHESAIIFFIRNGRVQQSQSLNIFIQEQQAVLFQSSKSMVERMKSFAVDEDRNGATASVEWELLIDGGKIDEGVDRFTMIRDSQGNWKIVALVWYKTRKK